MRGLDDVDPLSELGADAPCWCRSGMKHGACHGNPLPPSTPGEPITGADDDDHVYISPTATVERPWLETGLHGAPAFLPDESLVPPHVVVPDVVERMVQPSPRTPVSLAVLGAQRFEILDFLGLADPDRLVRRVAELSEKDLADLRLFFLSMASSTLDCLSGDDQSLADKAVIWAGDADPTTMVGATLLWADHYLITDRVTELLISSTRPVTLARELGELLALRPLIETGMVVPVLEDAAALAAANAIGAGTETDLQTAGLVEWIDSQLVMEGPTARECVLYSAIDDDEEDVSFHALSRIIGADDATRTVFSRMLGAYDPGFDYGPWVAQTRREHIASVVHNVNRQVAIADAFGAEWVTTSPFKQRLLLRRGNQPALSQVLIHAKVPQLSSASARALARVAAEDNSVAALRAAVRKSLRAMRSLPAEGQRTEAVELGRELQERADELAKEVSSDRRWKLTVSGAALGMAGAASTAAVVIGTAGPSAGSIDLLAGLGSLLGALGGAAPYLADRASHRRNAAFALLTGDGLVPPQRIARPTRHKLVPPITAVMTPPPPGQVPERDHAE